MIRRDFCLIVFLLSFYLSTGAKVTGRVCIGENVSVAANSVVNKSFGANLLLVGLPAQVKKSMGAWYGSGDGLFAERVRRVEQLRRAMGLEGTF